MKMKKSTIQILFTAVVCTMCFFACKEDEMFPETRLFRPVLNEDLRPEGNSIIINMAKLKNVSTYTVEISRDTFKTIDYTLELDTNYVVVDNELLAGDPLFWNMLYQVRATAHHATDPSLDSRISELGSVRTERFPSILNAPKSYDVTDIKARVTWTVQGSAVTNIKVFAGSDLKLLTPLAEAAVSEEDQEDGELIVEELDPSTKYQIAIYSGDVLRGWVDYTTLVPDIDPTSAGVVDIRTNEAPSAVADAVAAAADGAIILVKRGVFYDMPTVALNKSITIRAAYGFGEQRARLRTTGNWNIAGGSTIDHIRFIDLEVKGVNYAANYVFNPSVDNISVGELLFENCDIGTLRGIIRIRNTNVVIDNYKIINCVVDSLGGYGIITTDTSPNAVNPTARVNNIVLQNSTFNKLQMGISSQNNSLSILIDGCTFSNFITGGSGNYIFRYRGGAGNNDVTNGITIRNSIFGPGWDQSGAKVYAVRGREGLPNTLVDIVNTYRTSDFSFIATYEIPGFPEPNYSGSQTTLWVDPLITGNFNFKDGGFAGRYTTGDPRWRVKL
jgi:hypothetical protein